MTLFIMTLIVTFPLFFCAALVFNYCKKRVRKTGHGLSGTCGGGGIGCSCSATVQTMIQSSADKIR